MNDLHITNEEAMSFFIKLIDDPSQFIHMEPEDESQEPEDESQELEDESQERLGCWYISKPNWSKTKTMLCMDCYAEVPFSQFRSYCPNCGMKMRVRK